LRERPISLKDKPIWLFVATVGLIAFAFVYKRGQDINWDLLNYHYFTGYTLLDGNFKYDIAPSGLQSFLNPVPNVLAYLALSQLPFPVSAWMIAGVQLLALPLLYVLFVVALVYEACCIRTELLVEVFECYRD
jgi:hypothetical protein